MYDIILHLSQLMNILSITPQSIENLIGSPDKVFQRVGLRKQDEYTPVSQRARNR